MSNCLYILVCFVLFHKYVNKRQAACLSARRENQICILYQMVTRPPLCFTCIRTPTYGTSYYYYDSRTILGDAVESRRLRGEEKRTRFYDQPNMYKIFIWPGYSTVLTAYLKFKKSRGPS